jgi:hypothetical protein
VWITSPVIPERFRPDRCGIALVGRPTKPVVTIEIWEVSERFKGSELEAWLSSTEEFDRYQWAIKTNPKLKDESVAEQ